MTGTMTADSLSDKTMENATPPPHPHFTLASIAVMGIALAMIAAALAVVSLAITASRNSVDDGIVADKVDALLAAEGAANQASVAAADGVMVTGEQSVLPALIPKSQLPPAPQGENNVSYAPDVPRASGRNTPAVVDVRFEIVEGVTAIDPATGLEFETWGYRAAGDDQVVTSTPGPMIRARAGDVLRFTLTNPASNAHPHNIDLHAVTGQGGGAADTTVAPGETKTIEARLLYPGMFLYHCAFGDVPLHISRGMYGGILVDPESPLPPVDHELYIVQSEYYAATTDPGLADIDRQAVTDENPSLVVFNGAVGSLTGDNAPVIKVGERMRIYFVNAGLNLDSNFHPIGSHWDTVYREAVLLNAPLRGSQTTLVPAGGGTVVELIGQVPSTILLVDHALSRAFDKGALGQVVVEGDARPEMFEAIDPAPSAANAELANTDGDVPLTMLPGSSTTQPLDAPDEFSDAEDPADYSINVLTIAAGTTVTWTNDDEGQIHTVTAADGSFDSGFLSFGESWSYTFDEAGEYEYACTPHPWMRAKVVVTP